MLLNIKMLFILKIKGEDYEELYFNCSSNLFYNF